MDLASTYERLRATLDKVNPFQRRILGALQDRPPGQVYAGTANRRAVAKRRRRNKMARRTRQAQRRAA